MPKPPKAFEPVIVTANDLRSGAVVYRSRDGHWLGDVTEAEIAESEAAAADLLARAQADHDRAAIVEPVLIAIRREGGFVRPASLRELIRSAGPTIALPLGGGSHVPV